jgi:hypothetical protein
MKLFLFLLLFVVVDISAQTFQGNETVPGHRSTELRSALQASRERAMPGAHKQMEQKVPTPIKRQLSDRERYELRQQLRQQQRLEGRSK